MRPAQQGPPLDPHATHMPSDEPVRFTQAAPGAGHGILPAQHAVPTVPHGTQLFGFVLVLHVRLAPQVWSPQQIPLTVPPQAVHTPSPWPVQVTDGAGCAIP